MSRRVGWTIRRSFWRYRFSTTRPMRRPRSLRRLWSGWLLRGTRFAAGAIDEQKRIGSVRLVPLQGRHTELSPVARSRQGVEWKLPDLLRVLFPLRCYVDRVWAWRSRADGNPEHERLPALGESRSHFPERNTTTATRQRGLRCGAESQHRIVPTSTESCLVSPIAKSMGRPTQDSSS